MLSCFISWGGGSIVLWLASNNEGIGSLSFNSPIFLILAGAPSLAAISIVTFRHGVVGVKQLLSMFFSSYRWYWLVFAILIIPIVFFVILGVSATYRGIEFSDVLSSYYLWLVSIFTTTVLFSNPASFSEELGWRGFALPILLEITTPFRASIVVATMWIIWHLPAFFFSDAMAVETSNIVWWIMSTLAITLIMTSLFIRSNGNILAAGVLPHMFINSSSGLIDTGSTDSLLMLIIAYITFVLLESPRRQ